jgi:hypothetical protein
VCSSSCGTRGAWNSRRSSCLRWLHRLGFTWKRPKKRLIKASASKRAAFVREFIQLTAAAGQSGAKHWFVDEAHFRAEGDLRGKWVQRGERALVDSTSPRRAEKVTRLFGRLSGDRGGGGAGSGRLQQPGGERGLAPTTARHIQPTIGGLLSITVRRMQGMPYERSLSTPDLGIQLVRLPPYSPDYNADEAIWDWARKEATSNTCLGTKAAVRERVDAFFASLQERKEEVKRRCRSVLQAEATALATV